MSTRQDIRKALENIIDSATGLPVIAWENVKEAPQEEASWIRSRLMISESKPAAVGAGNAVLWRGLYLLDCFAKQNLGPAVADSLSDDILALFPYGTQIVENGITINIRFSEGAGAIQDDPWYYVPVTITWYAYVG